MCGIAGFLDQTGRAKPDLQRIIQTMTATLARRGPDDAALYRRLATLRTDVPLSESLDDLEWRGARRDELEPLCASLGETRLVERVSRWRD